jgi:hypothetical protein
MSDKTGVPIVDGLDLDHLFAHVASLGAIFATVVGWLPAIAAFVAVLWYIIQIWESKTVQRHIHAWKEKRHARHRRH